MFVAIQASLWGHFMFFLIILERTQSRSDDCWPTARSLGDQRKAGDGDRGMARDASSHLQWREKYIKIRWCQVTWHPRCHYPSLPTQPLSPLILVIIKDVIAARSDQATVRNTRWTKRLARYDPSSRTLIDDHGNTTSDRWPQQPRFACDESDNQTDVTSLA